METLTISEGFQRMIGARTVLNAFFTTYCFEPDFFELEVLPLLLGNPALSSNEAIRYVQLQSLMSDCKDRFAVAYDVDVFDPRLAPHLEVDYIPIRAGYGCQHAKIAVIELVDELSESISVVLAVGSFNLTKAGWWENVEVGHWVELSAGYAPSNILKPLLSALDYYETKQLLPVLMKLRQRLVSLDKANLADDPKCSFYFSGEGAQRLNFFDFIRERNLDNNGSLEIISPFFAEDGKNQQVASFLNEFKSVELLLPTDENGQALIDCKVYKDLQELGVIWSKWQKHISESLDVVKEKSVYRKLHAKIYQCLSSKPWIFLGSVNLSYKAFSANVEAGFLLQEFPLKQMLTACSDMPSAFGEVDKEATVVNDGSIAMPVFYLVYDWLEGKLELTSSKTGDLKLFDSSENLLVVTYLKQGEKQSINLPELGNHLKQSSLVKGVWEGTEVIGEASRTLLISQRNLFCRPSELPSMSLIDLLRIFQDMHAARRTELMAELASRMITLRHDNAFIDENLPVSPADKGNVSFFSEFSQVNGAFWMLKEKLKQAKFDGKDEILSYYLKGCQPDSLRGVLDSTEVSEPPSLVVRYLTLLSVAELLENYQLEADSELIARVAQAIEKTESDPGFDNVPDKTKFLVWVKQKFRQPIKGSQKLDSTLGDQYAAS